MASDSRSFDLQFPQALSGDLDWADAAGEEERVGLKPPERIQLNGEPLAYGRQPWVVLDAAYDTGASLHREPDQLRSLVGPPRSVHGKRCRTSWACYRLGTSS